MSVPYVDATARVAAGARLADDVEVGPYCVVGPQVELRSGVKLLSHANIGGKTIIGERSVAYCFVSLGTAPQSTAHRGEPTTLTVGADCQFREGVTISTGTVKGGGATVVGDRCFMMVNSHVGHDCIVGNDVTFANNAVLGGHVTVGDHVFLGGQTAVHQFVRVGEGAMVGGVSGIAGDIIPFGFCLGQRAELVGLNIVGLRRRGHSREDIHRIRDAYRLLFLGPGLFADRFRAAEAEFAGVPLVGKVLDFIRARESRPLMMAGSEQAGFDDTQ